MFTGIVEALGIVDHIDEMSSGRRLHVRSAALRPGAVGDSVAVNGVCLTVVELGTGGFLVEVVAETLSRSNLGSLVPGDAVDLELPLAASGRFDGHIVQGHVDGVGTVSRIDVEGDSKRVRIGVDAELGRFLVEKGSVTVDGVSLTVTATTDDGFEVVLIPHTLDVTVLGRRDIGDRVNVEVDVLAKYVAKSVATIVEHHVTDQVADQVARLLEART